MNSKNSSEWITVTRPDLPPLEEYVEHLKKIWERKWLTNDGDYLKLLEKELAKYLKVKNVLAVCNGTLALHIAVKALELKGEVITTPFTFAATTNVLVWEGLKPIFADIDPETFNIDPKDVERKITSKTDAIIAVHVYGNPCYVEELQKIAEKYDLKIIYDAAHAFGVEYKGRSVLEWGDVSILSFHATKLFHTIEGGALVSKDESVLEKIRLLRNHGIKSEDEVVLPGTNAKMNEFQAIMGLLNLKYLDEKIKRREILYHRYKKELQNEKICFQKLIASKYNYAYMPIVLRDNYLRDRIYNRLAENRVKSRKYFYPITACFQYQKEDFVKKFNLRNSFDISNRVLCLPLYSDLSFEEQDKVIDIVNEVLSESP